MPADRSNQIPIFGSSPRCKRLLCDLTFRGGFAKKFQKRCGRNRSTRRFGALQTNVVRPAVVEIIPVRSQKNLLQVWNRYAEQQDKRNKSDADVLADTQASIARSLKPSGQQAYATGGDLHSWHGAKRIKPNSFARDSRVVNDKKNCRDGGENTDQGENQIRPPRPNPL